MNEIDPVEIEKAKIVGGARHCDCRYCTIHYPFIKRMKASLPEEEYAILEEILDEWMTDGEDLSYYKAIFNGSWPDSVEILRTRALQIENNEIR